MTAYWDDAVWRDGIGCHTFTVHGERLGFLMVGELLTHPAHAKLSVTANIYGKDIVARRDFFSGLILK